TFATGAGPLGLAVRDVNGDGKLDLVATNAAAGSVSVLLGNGDGTLAARQDFTTGNAPYAVAVGDLNGDGRPDVIVADAGSNKVSVLLGNALFQGPLTAT